MNLHPILNIKQFDTSFDDGNFYSNIFSEHLEKFHNAITLPHKHDFYLIVLFTKGVGTHEVDFVEYPIKPGYLFFLKPGQTHHWEFTQSAEGYIFFHTKEFYQMQQHLNHINDYPIFFSNQNSALIKLDDAKLKNKALNIMKSIHSEFTQSHPLKHKKIALLVDLLYIEISRVIWDSNKTIGISDSKNNIYLKKLEDLIEEHFLTLKKPSDYSSLLNITTKHLNKIVNSSIGKTTGELIHERILLEAKRMLIKQDSNIQEIAFYLGYDDPSYFSRLFKSKCGVKPNNFIKKYQS